MSEISAWALVIWLLYVHFFLGCAHAGERPTLGQCMAASAVAGAHNYEWQEKKFTREDCEAITAPAPQGAQGTDGAISQKPDQVDIHIHNPPAPPPVIIQKPAPTINIHIHNEGAPANLSLPPQSTLSDAPATNLKNAHTPRNRYTPSYVPSDVRPDLFLFPPRDHSYCCTEYETGPYPKYGCDPYYGAGCGY